MSAASSSEFEGPLLDLGSYVGLKRGRLAQMSGSAAAGGGGMEFELPSATIPASSWQSSSGPLSGTPFGQSSGDLFSQSGYKRRLIGPLMRNGNYFRRRSRRGYNRKGYRTKTYKRRRARRYGRRSYGSRGYHNTNIVVGRGGYWGRYLGEKVGLADVGDRIGDLVGAGVRHLTPYGGAIMSGVNALGTAHSMWRGRGDYETIGNDIIHGGGVGHSVVPQFTPSRDGNAVVISHKEYIGDVFGPTTGAFQVQTFALNPGLEATFPWLSQLASNYQEYELRQCIMTYRSTVTDFAATSGQQGIVISATQYNPSEPVFSDKASMMEYDGAMSCKVTQNLLSGVECDPAKNALGGSKYIRSGPVTGMQDLKTYDMGNFSIGVLNVPAAYSGQSIGELWVSYTIVLRKPKFYTARGYNNSFDRFLCRNRTLSIIGANGNLANPFVGAILKGAGNNIGCKLIAADGVVASGSAPEQSPTVTVVFPANYSGNVRVSMTIGFSTASGSAMTASPQVYGAGNIRPISDRPGLTAGLYSNWEIMTHQSTSVAPGYPIQQWAIGNEGVSGARYDYYEAVTPSTGGVDNTLTFVIPGLPNSGVAVCLLAHLEVCEVNTVGDSSPTGPNYTPLWIDQFGTPQVDNPAYWT